MAFYNEDEDDEQSGEQQAPGTPESGTLDAAGAANSPAGAQASTGGSGSADHFVGISDYINANKPQSEKLAKTVGGVVTGQGDQARTALDQGKSAFDQDVAANTVNFDSGLADRVKNQAESLSTDERDTFKKQRDASYAGPSSFQSSNYYAPAQQAVQKATQAAENTRTEAGQREILKPIQQQAKHGTTAGIGTFDSALLQAAPNARTELEGARQSIADVDPRFQQLLSDALQGAGAAKATTDQTSTQAKGVLGEGVQGLNVPQRYQDYLSGVEGYNSGLQNSLSAPGEAAASFFGVDPNTDTYGVNSYGGYLNQSTPASLGEFASPEDYARYQALRDLGGQFDFELGDPSQAGTAGDRGKATADKDRLLNDISAAKAGFENKFNTQKVTGVAPMFADMTLAQIMPQISASWNTALRPQMQAALDQINALRSQYGLGKVLIDAQTGQPIYAPNQTLGGGGLGGERDI